MSPRPPRRPPGGGEPPGVAARRVAWSAVRRVHADDAWAAPAVDAALSRSGLDARDRAFAANLAFETLRWEGTLDWLLGHVVRRDLADVQPELLDVLRLGAWQLRFGRVPDRAAVDTSVELARRYVGSHTAGFVNGVLRALVRSGPDLPAGDDPRSVGLRVGMPPWTVELARERFGGRAEAVLAAGNDAPGLVLRAAPLDGDGAGGRTAARDALVAELAAAGWGAGPGRHPAAVAVPGGVAADIPAVAEGRATVQDEASMYVQDAVVHGIGGAGGLVVDVCAGPGGKTTGLAETGLRVLAADVRPVRAQLIAGLAGRTHDVGRRVHVVTADAARPPVREHVADAVLVDAPCTGLGVVRRRPELRWRRQPDDPARLSVLQRELLGAAAPLVRPGGVLVYSVCTWPSAETVDVVTDFLADAGDWTAESPGLTVGTHVHGDPGVQITPDRDDADGMYIAVLRRSPR